MSQEPSQSRPKRLSEIPISKSPRMQVVRLKGSQRLRGVILSKHFVGFQIHWNPSIRRSLPHFDELERCEGCQKKLPEKTVWYLHLLSTDKGQVFVELPPNAARGLLDQLAEGESLRGLWVTISRSQADNGRVRAVVDDQLQRRTDLPPAVDPESTLSALWNWGRQ